MTTVDDFPELTRNACDSDLSRNLFNERDQRQEQVLLKITLQRSCIFNFRESKRSFFQIGKKRKRIEEKKKRERENDKSVWNRMKEMLTETEGSLSDLKKNKGQHYYMKFQLYVSKSFGYPTLELASVIINIVTAKSKIRVQIDVTGKQNLF